jgi:hypothetical protein
MNSPECIIFSVLGPTDATAFVGLCAMENNSPLQRLARNRLKLRRATRDPHGYSTHVHPRHVSQNASTTLPKPRFQSNAAGSDEKTDSSTCDNAGSELSSLFGDSIQDVHLYRIPSSTSVNSTLMGYSTDDASSAENSTKSERSRPTTVPKKNIGCVHYYNPQTIYTGTFLVSVLGSSSSSHTSELESKGSMESDSLEDDLMASDHYFTDPLDTLSSPLPQYSNLRVSSSDEMSANTKCYIFTDDDDDCLTQSSKYRTADLATLGSRIGMSDLSQVSPHTWEKYNQNRGRIVAQQMLQPFRHRDEEDNTDPLSDDDDMKLDGLFERHRPFFLGRVFGRKKAAINPSKRFTESTSPLDNCSNQLRRHTVKRHRVSDLACQAIADAERGSTTDSSSSLLFNRTKRVNGDSGSSAVLTRNMLVDFGAWEALLRNKDPIDSKRDEFRLKDCALEETSHSAADEGHDDDESVLFIKAASLLVQDFIFGNKDSAGLHRSTRPYLSDDGSLHKCDDESCAFERRTAEEIAVALGIAQDGCHLLGHIRGRAGIIEYLQNDDDDESGNGLSLPWIHLFDDVWMPHYEEYVVRAVHSFSRLLMNSTTR